MPQVPESNLDSLLAPAATTTSLHSLALTNHFCGAAPHAPHMTRVDVRIWFEQCQQSSWFCAHPQSGQNPALYSFIYCGWPTMKRNKVLNLDHWMVRPTQHILDVFNIQWVTCEAEVELSLMNKKGAIDVVMTDDSDAFIFGAQTRSKDADLCLYNSSTLSSNNTVNIYTTDAIRQQVAPSLQCEGFVLMAVCCKGDYDKTGPYGCGQSTALGLVNILDVTNSLCIWHRNVCEHLACDPTQKIGCLCPTLAHTLPDTFQEPNIVSTSSPGLLGPQPPNIPALATLMQEPLGWENPGKMLTMFQSTIWPAVIVKEMLLDLCRNSVKINEVVLGISSMCIEVSMTLFVGDALLVMSAAAAQHYNSVKPGKLCVCVPDCIFKCWQDAMFPVSSPLAHVSQGASSYSSLAPCLPSINVPLGSANSH
ncbi:hypothetical protein PAXRUDRAFT_35556 [Paxillus rubicundulus Ve08.2h10]|uniref:XPG-I domain-containing protein n=1 Tax=Paxillus rubicundulus Ve08.2h10 TaxID=930991 RepID=A0A0D0DDV1_9AGAM|nr:hypothetical protein PAXRUDRAFT_35556 [Paxillus rubicundulus Ve08.2h10]